MNVLNLRLWSLLLLLGLAGCGSPIVGLECKPGLTRCGNACYDLDSDEEHCGICDRRCGDVAMCVEGSCVAIGPGGDGGTDGSVPMGDAGSDGGTGVFVDAAGRDCVQTPESPGRVRGQRIWLRPGIASRVQGGMAVFRMLDDLGACTRRR